jgi:hypothetical protein
MDEELEETGPRGETPEEELDVFEELISGWCDVFEDDEEDYES